MSAAYRIERISFAYGDVSVLDIDALEIAESRITALVGPNGSGKTTLLNLLAFLEMPLAGTLRFFGETVTPGSLAALRRRIGFVQQKPYLFHASVRRNVELGLRWRGTEARVRVRRAEQALHDFDLEAMADRPAARLSGGEAQRLALARALVLDPAVLLLDEPFTHLDREARSRLEERLVRIRDEQGRTIVFSTHDHQLAQRLAGTLVNLASGHLVNAAGVNLFAGRTAAGYFETGRLRIRVAGLAPETRQIAVDAGQIVLSLEELKSSMRNNFRGTIRALVEQDGGVQVTVDAGETFRVLVTRESLGELRLGIGSVVWVGFKSSAVQQI